MLAAPPTDIFVQRLPCWLSPTPGTVCLSQIPYTPYLLKQLLSEGLIREGGEGSVADVAQESPGLNYLRDKVITIQGSCGVSKSSEPWVQWEAGEEEGDPCLKGTVGQECWEFTV